MQKLIKYQNSYIWLDWVRVIGIYSVVLAHLALPTLSKNWIYSFHMPLFFFISGFLFTIKKKENFLHFFKKKAKNLLLPYLLFNVLTYAVWLVKMKVKPDDNIDILNVFYQIFYGGLLPHNTPLWFLIALFLVEIILYVPLSKNKGWVMVIVFLILSWLTQYIGWLPLYIDAAIVGVPFFVIAYIYKDWIVKALNINRVFKMGLFLLLFIVTFCSSEWNGRVDMLSNSFGYNFFLFEFGAIAGITMVFMLGKICETFWGNIPVVKYVSRNTLIVLALHIAVLGFIKGFFMIIHIDNSIWNSCLFNVLISVVVIVILLPVIYIIKRYVPWLIGKW